MKLTNVRVLLDHGVVYPFTTDQPADDVVREIRAAISAGTPTYKTTDPRNRKVGFFVPAKVIAVDAVEVSDDD